jgi:hypothetical protein
MSPFLFVQKKDFFEEKKNIYTVHFAGKTDFKKHYFLFCRADANIFFLNQGIFCEYIKKN